MNHKASQFIKPFWVLMAAIVVLTGSLYIAHADELPDLGDISAATLSPLQERQIGDQILREVATSPEVVQDAEISDYIKNIGAKLVENGPDQRQQFDFFVVQDNSINAFAMPGGVIGVHTGLILAANTESEVAGVLGHEIGHVTQRHLARMMASQKYDTFKNLAGVALALLVSRSNPQLASGALMTSSAIGIQNQLDYTREHEREADRIGLQILQSGGFDVRGMPAFFTTLQRSSRLSEGNTPGFLRTHPLTSERIADVANRVDKLPYKQVADSLEFLYVRAKLRASEGSPENMIALFEDNLAEKRYTSAAAEHYGLAVAYLRKNAYAKAAQEVDWLEKNAPPHAMFATLKAQLLVAQNNPQRAGEYFAQAIKRYPDSRALMYGYATHLIALRQNAQAIQLIKDKLLLYPKDPHSYELLAKAYAAQNKNLLSHAALGEAHARQYNTARALEQMEIAVKANDGDFYERSIVEARLKQLRQQLEVETKKS